MKFLYMLEGIRTPLLNKLMLLITELGTIFVLRNQHSITTARIFL